MVLIAAAKPFEIVDSDGNHIIRNIPQDWDSDFAVYWNDKYIDANETRNGYYEIGEEVIPVTNELFKERSRNLKEYAYIIVPQGTATSVMRDRTPTEKLLNSIVESANLTDAALGEYLNATRSRHSKEIMMYI